MTYKEPVVRFRKAASEDEIYAEGLIGEESSSHLPFVRAGSSRSSTVKKWSKLFKNSEPETSSALKNARHSTRSNSE